MLRRGLRGSEEVQEIRHKVKVRVRVRIGGRRGNEEQGFDEKDLLCFDYEVVALRTVLGG